MPMPRPTPRATPLLEEELGVYVGVEVEVEDVAVVDMEEVGVTVGRVDVESVVGREMEVEREVLGGGVSGWRRREGRESWGETNSVCARAVRMRTVRARRWVESIMVVGGEKVGV